MKHAVVAVSLVFAFGGCSSTTTTGAPGTGNPGNPAQPTPGSDGGTPEAPGDSGTPQVPLTPKGSYSVTWGPVVAPAGEEHTQCVVMRLGNPAAMHVGTVRNQLSKGSHHLIVYQVSDTVEQTTPYDCRPFQDTFDPTKGAPMMITQKADDLLTLPDGVGYSLNANQMIRLEMHYINAGAQPLTVTATSTMTPLPEADLKAEADVLLIGSTSINLPPKASTTLGPVYIPLPAAYAGSNFFAITGHEHQMGKNVRVSTAGATGGVATSVYDVPDWLWSEPKTLFATPPFNVPTGGGFNLTCDWQNTSDKTVSFGESANDEMCFFWAYYYPRKAGSRVILAH